MEITENQQSSLPESIEREEMPESGAETAGAIEQTETAGEADSVAEAETETQEGATVSREEVDRLVTEAEQRGYLRGRNEVAKQLMERTQLLGNPLIDSELPSGKDGQSSEFAKRFLSRLPRGVWD